MNAALEDRRRLLIDHGAHLLVGGGIGGEVSDARDEIAVFAAGFQHQRGQTGVGTRGVDVGVLLDPVQTPAEGDHQTVVPGILAEPGGRAVGLGASPAVFDQNDPGQMGAGGEVDFGIAVQPAVIGVAPALDQCRLRAFRHTDAVGGVDQRIFGHGAEAGKDRLQARLFGHVEQKALTREAGVEQAEGVSARLIAGGRGNVGGGIGPNSPLCS